MLWCGKVCWRQQAKTSHLPIRAKLCYGIWELTWRRQQDNDGPLPAAASIGQNVATTWEGLSVLLFAPPGWSKAGFNARNRIVLCTLLQLEKCSYGTGVLLGL